MKKKLQDLFPNSKLMTVYECIDSLNWSTENPPSDKSGTGKITCDCGEIVKVGGWVGTEHAWCPGCHKGMQDLTGILPHLAITNGAGVCQHIDYDKTVLPQDGRRWIPENVWGY